MTAQRVRKWAAATFIAALVVLGIVLMNSAGTGSLVLIFGQLLVILLAGLAVVLMVVSLFFPHEIE